MRLGFAFGSSALLVSILAAGGCSNISDDCETTSTCDPIGGSSSGGSSSGSAGKSGSSGNNSGGSSDAGEGTGGSSAGTAGTAGNAGAGGGECDITASPATESCLVSDDHAVFVAPDGSDDDAGTKAAPFASLSKAVEAAGSKLVLVCSGSYDEHVSITAGVRAFGGFDCTDWNPSATKPLFKPTTAGPALEVDTVTDEVLLEGLAFEVGDAVGAGESAVAAIVSASPSVTLRSVSLTAGNGQTGASGAVTNFSFPNASALNGNAENPATMGGGEKICACQPTLMSVGGGGGPPSSTGQAGAKGGPDHGGGQGGDPEADDCGAGSSGKKGTDAPARSAAAGAATLGTASASGWASSSGSDGATGQPGQGGGGGASLNASGHGGGGGCGGCGGNGGTAGKGGGGSIALLALDSPVVLEALTLTTADAGDGGNGAAGQAGQQDVGSGGNSIASANSCGGGTGGKGGAGGAGGGGAGGISVGVLWQGDVAPTVSADTTIANGDAGANGTGGAVGTNDGIAGVSQKVLELN